LLYTGLVPRSEAEHNPAMPDEPRKIFDLMDTETEPTDEQLAELMHYVGEAIRAESAELTEMAKKEIARAAEASPPYGQSSST
jgi:hypothetical protein